MSMLTEVKLTPTQEKKLAELKEGDLSIAYTDGDLILMQTTESETIYCWGGREWVAYSSPDDRSKIIL
jgi:hypothetical protein